MQLSPITSMQVVRHNVVAALILFALPAFGFWFTGHASRALDEEIVTEIVAQIRSDTRIADVDKPRAEAFYRRAVASRVCATTEPELAPLRAEFGSTCDSYWQFRMARRTALVTLALGLLAMVIAAGGALAAFVSRASQYRSFVVSFHALRAITAIVVVLQGALAVFLSYWMTAIWFDRYVPKLILAVAVLAIAAVVGILKAMFTRLPTVLPVDGVLVRRENATRLFERIDRICSALGTQAPSHLVVGIDSNFFVSEGTFQVQGMQVEGRLLYVSLALLRVLSASEADAVLAHEMAHFSGGDVEHSRKLAPALQRFGVYVDHLNANLLSKPIGRFLVSFESLFALAARRTKREREFAADAEAARLTSPDDIARALVRIGAYASFGNRIETMLFETNATHDTLGIRERIDRGFEAYAVSPKLGFDLLDAFIPHPFDSHPPLLERIANAGSTIRPEDFSRIVAEQPSETCFDSIDDAGTIEARQWAEHEERFRAAHELSLAHRYEPATDEERALVERYFPRLAFARGTEDEHVVLEPIEIRCSKWQEPVRLDLVERAELKDALGGKQLILVAKGDGVFSGGHKIRVGDLGGQKDAFLAAFNRYWNRARAAAAYRSSRS